MNLETTIQNISLANPPSKTGSTMPKRTPSVNQANEFREIANDFTNPLELIREAISNSFDAQATNITLSFEVLNVDGEDVFKVFIKDDGEGMDDRDLENFFDLGNSKRLDDKDKIGEKGHGTKVYFNSKRIELRSQKKNCRGVWAEMNNVFQSLNRGIVPEYEWDFHDEPMNTGTEIIIWGYFQGQLSLFTHARIKDYILWKTKFGSIEKQFKRTDNDKVRIHFKGLDEKNFTTLDFGHVFPAESENSQKLFEKHDDDAPHHFCRKWIDSGKLPRHPHIEYEAVFYVEGKNVKYSYNEMIKRPGKASPAGAYTTQERYGLWLCKDYIPIQTKNDWISSKGYEYTRFHAFFNCQNFKLTANRGSVDNTSPEIIADIESVVKEFHKKISETEDYSMLDWLETQVKDYVSKEKERKEYTRRSKGVLKQNVAYYKGVRLVEPELESGVYALLILMTVLEPDLFPFEVVDYNTNVGLDLLVREKSNVTLEQVRIFYVELKNKLSSNFNHTFEYLHSMICWDTKVKDGDIVFDLGNNKRTFRIANPEKEGDITSYYLEDGKGGRNITVFVLKDFLKQKLNIDFRPRNNKAD